MTQGMGEKARDVSPRFPEGAHCLQATTRGRECE